MKMDLSSLTLREFYEIFSRAGPRIKSLAAEGGRVFALL